MRKDNLNVSLGSTGEIANFKDSGHLAVAAHQRGKSDVQGGKGYNAYPQQDSAVQGRAPGLPDSIKTKQALIESVPLFLSEEYKQMMARSKKGMETKSKGSASQSSKAKAELDKADAAAKKKIEELTKATHTKVAQEASTTSAEYNDYKKFEAKATSEIKAQMDSVNATKDKLGVDVDDIQAQIK